MTPRVERYVRRQFDEADAELVLDALREWRTSYVEEAPSERLIAAVVLAADGRLEGVDDGLRLGEEDWRDLLVAAGLAHEDWRAVLSSRMGPAD